MTKAVLERALGEELTEHLGYEPHERAATGNARSGTSPKPLITEAGSVDLDVPRDRAGSFEPGIGRKGQRCLDGIDKLVISLCARGMTVRDIRAHLVEIYAVDVWPDPSAPGTARATARGSPVTASRLKMIGGRRSPGPGDLVSATVTR